jgi:hypothetical protein
VAAYAQLLADVPYGGPGGAMAGQASIYNSAVSLTRPFCLIYAKGVYRVLKLALLVLEEAAFQSILSPSVARLLAAKALYC